MNGVNKRARIAIEKAYRIKRLEPCDVHGEVFRLAARDRKRDPSPFDQYLIESLLFATKSTSIGQVLEKVTSCKQAKELMKSADTMQRAGYGECPSAPG